MGNQSGYTPLFKGALPADAASRWQLIRRFVDRWCMGNSGFLLDRSQEDTPLIRQARALAQGELSFSIRQWLSLAEEAGRRDAPHIRDCLMAEPIEVEFEHPDVKNATVILMQGEGDIFWTVANRRLSEADPPVDIFQCFDEDSPPYLGCYGSVSEFALAYLCTYNDYAEGCVEWFSAEGTEEELALVRRWFDHSLVIASPGICCGEENYRFCELLERDGFAALMHKGSVDVSAFCDPSSAKMPPFLRDAMDSHLKVRQENCARAHGQS